MAFLLLSMAKSQNESVMSWDGWFQLAENMSTTFSFQDSTNQNDMRIQRA
jgi:hypothetical protein